jgi:PhzF family phenazine biosynthesis protein
MPQRIVQVDAFTDRPFAGNPAAVVLLDGPADAVWMQSVAAEMNLAETAFLERRADGWYGLRWFTPTVEVDLCGHATLASAHVLWTEGLDTSEVLTFETRSGELRARRIAGAGIELDVPALHAEPMTPGPEVVAALGVVPVAVAATDNGWLLVEVATAAEVRAAAPDQARLAASTDHIIVVTALGDGADIVSRVFATAFGIPEDPVTGSAHCLLATWWWARLGKDPILAEQASARGGRLEVSLEGDRVRLRGSAVTTVRGELVA